MIRWGMIGCGDVSERKSGPAFNKVKDSKLMAVMRRTGHLAEDYATRHNVPHWYTDADDIINNPQIDAVYIATPPDTHCDYTLRCAEAGKPVYVEKPMARTFAECQTMVEACQESGVPLFVAYYRRMLPRFIKVKGLLAANIIGSPRTVNITLHRRPLNISAEARQNPSLLPWRVQPEISGGGLFVDLACHTLDFLDYLFGPVTLAKGYASNQGSPYPAEDLVTGSFVFENGVQGTGIWCFNSFRPQDWVEITGTVGKIGFSTFGDDPIILTDRNGETKFMFRNPYHIQQPLIETVMQALRGEGECPSTGLSAARTNWVMDQLLGQTDFAQPE